MTDRSILPEDPRKKIVELTIFVFLSGVSDRKDVD